MSPPAASWLNRSTDKQRPLPATLTGLNHLDGHILVAVGQLPELLRQHIQRDGSLVLGMLVHDQLGELLLIGLATRQIRHPYLLDCHRWPPRSNSGTA
jgi:hypothetical protein